jgi:hypothetical protein
MPGLKTKIFLTVIALSAAFSCKNAYAQVVSSAELISKAREYDGKEIVYQGEVIGDKMPRGAFAWVNVHDGKNAIGVWAPAELVRDILFTGDYKHKGDVIRVAGIFNRSCQEHGGDLDIHGRSISKISDGVQVKEKVSAAKARLVLILAGISGLIWILIRLKQR